MSKPMTIAAASLIALTLASTPAYASSEQGQAQRKIEEGAEALLDGMKMLLKSIPWYSQPVMKPNGDIVIPRREGPPLPKSNPRNQDQEEDDDTKRL